MRGRTNISGGGGFIDGQLEKYEIADGKTVTKGQFVEFETEPTTKPFTKNPFYDHYEDVPPKMAEKIIAEHKEA